MYLIQLFLPLYDNQGRAFEPGPFAQTRDELLQRFSGLTQFSRAPVKGIWEPKDDQPVRDDLVIYEVMADQLDRAWWHQFRLCLEQRFRQERILIRAESVELL